MLNFDLCLPTQFVFGKETEYQVGKLIKKYKGLKIMVIYGGNSAVRSGLINRVCECIEEKDLEYILEGGVASNPRLSFVRNAMKKAQEENVDFLLAVGGGSVIDTAKALAVGIAAEKSGLDFWEYLFDGKIYNYEKVEAIEKDVLPFGVILTHAAAGSEGGDGLVVVKDDEEVMQKVPLHGGRSMRAKFAIMNPELTYTVPAYQTAAGISDIMSHIIERYFTNTEDVEINDGLCESLLKTIIKAAYTVVKEPDNYQARADIMWVGMLAHCDLLSCDRIPDFTTHPMELQVSGGYDQQHGAGMAVLLPEYIKYTVYVNPVRSARFAREVFGVKDSDQIRAGIEGADRLRAFYTEIGLPSRLRDLTVPKEDLPRLAEQVVALSGSDHYGNYMGVYVEDCLKIYENCW